MVFLRATKKVLGRLPSVSQRMSEEDGTALGDWYVNRVVVDRRPLLLLISSKSLLPILLPARDVRGLPDRLIDLVDRRLKRLGIDPDLVRAEVNALAPVHVGPTTDRSILGILTDFSCTLPYYLDGKGWGEAELLDAEQKLTCTPCFASRRHEDVVYPDRKSFELIAKQWSPGHTARSMPK